VIKVASPVLRGLGVGNDPRLLGNKMLHAELTDKIISSFFKVYNTLGYGFLEKVYENALVIELKRAGLMFYNNKILKSTMKIR
jgi:hypothetical protein